MSRKGSAGSCPLSLVVAVSLLPLAVMTLVDPGAAQEASDCETGQYVSSDVPKPIPGRGVANSVITVPTGSRVHDVDVHVDVTHPFDSDLLIELVSPKGKKVVLAEAVGTWGDNFSDSVFDDEADISIVSSLPPFAGRYRPAERLAAFNGAPRGGTWKLRVSDLRSRYAGQIESWQLDLVSCADSGRARVRAGAPDPPPLPEGAPAEAEPVEGRLMTVTTTSDMSNGDVSTVDALEASPGPDGISLREAIEATNNDPGTYTIHFDASLTGANIVVSFVQLPVLRGGGVFIDGDIDGDGRPDVALVADSGAEGGWAMNIASSGNRLHALSLSGFRFGVVFTAMRNGQFDAPLLKDQTFASNIVSGLVLADIIVPIVVEPTFWHQGCEESPCSTGSRWTDTRIVGNTTDSRLGISVGWHFDNTDTMRRVTVAGNHIDLRRGSEFVNGIDLTVGTGGSRDNRITDALVAYNTIEMGGGINGVQVVAGQQGRSGNVVEDVRIVGNAVHFSGAPRRSTEGVAIFVSDGCWPAAPDCHNVVRHVEVVGNLLEGPYVGVRVGEPCCGAGGPEDALRDVWIAANVIDCVILGPAEFLNPWGVVIGGLGTGTSNIGVASNKIVQRVGSPKAGAAGNLTAGGIALIGGLGKGLGPEQDTFAPSLVRGVSVTNNRVATKLMGIVLLGGGPYGARFRIDPALGNRVSSVTLRGNMITRAPVLATRWFPRIKGISLIGGLAGPARPYRGWRARRNAVTCVTLRRNVVAGSGRGVALLPNLGAGASRNVARLGGC